MKIEYKSTWFGEKTAQKVKDIIVNAIASKQRIRVFYGDISTGLCWLEEHDIIGTIGRSTGSQKIPLLLHKTTSMGGCPLLDEAIVKITIDKKVVYQHPSFHIPKLTATGKDVLFENGTKQASFKSDADAVNYIAFMNGSRNRI